MMDFCNVLGDEIEDASEETFDLFAQSRPSVDLGMLDPRANALELTVGNRDYTFAQSPGQLQSKLAGGTTGAAIWRTSIRVAEWLSDTNNVLYQNGWLNSDASVLELGSGISGLVPLTLAPNVGRIVATDQRYLLKRLRENIDTNLASTLRASSRSTKRDRTSGSGTVEIVALDWEETAVPPLLSTHGLGAGLDVVVACDCVYNYALIEPFVQTCADICAARNRRADGDAVSKPTLCIVAQQLRQPEVFEEWLETLMRTFRVWRAKDELLSDGLKGGSGFCVHIAVLR